MRILNKHISELVKEDIVQLVENKYPESVTFQSLMDRWGCKTKRWFWVYL